MKEAAAFIIVLILVVFVILIIKAFMTKPEWVDGRKTDAYDEGVEAGSHGVYFWQNPYAKSTQSQHSYHRWSAGWCAGKQIAEGAK